MGEVPHFGRWVRAAGLVAALALAACGGGGGGGGAAPPPAGNGAPTFTSGATASAAENAAGTVYTAAATDPEGQTVSYSIAGGADAARFQINASTGAVSFAAAPNFELPADANRNNVYELTLRASDGTASTDRAVQITVTNVAGRLGTVRVASGLTQPLFLTGTTDQSGRVYVVEKQGLIRILNPATGQIAATPFLDLTGTLALTSEQGLLGFVLAPDFATSGTFYVYVTPPNGNIEVRRYRTLANDRDRADTATADVILAIAHPTFDNHNGGWLAFGPDQLLYIATGDGGGAGDPLGNGQNLSTLNGKILRVDVRSDSFPSDPNRDYAIPPANPFATAGGAPEIWVFGLRNPFRNSFDRETGNLYVGDVGQNEREEISLVRSTDGGRNYGWNILEGTFQFSPGSTSGLTPPITEYAHGSGALQGRSVTGGYVYRGPIAGFRGQYVFGDFVNRRVWTLPVAQVSQGTTLTSAAWTDRTTEFAPALGAIGNISSFGEDDIGNVYIVDFDGEVFLITEIE